MGLDKAKLDQLRIDRRRSSSAGGKGWWVAGVLLLLLLVGGFYWWMAGDQRIEVSVVTVSSSEGAGPQAVLNASGYVTARREATVSAKVTGKIEELKIEEGDSVKEGEVLARLDLSNVEANLSLAESQRRVTQAALRETQARLKEAEQELTRVESLVAQGILTPSELDAAMANFESLRARLERQREEVVVEERQVEVWQQEREDRIVRAPFAGVVISKDAQPGEMVSPLSAGGGFTRTGICTLVDMDSLEIEVDVNESFINRVEPGQPVEARLDAYPSWAIPCHVIAIIPTADRQKATVKVRIALGTTDPRILPDMGVKVAFLEKEAASRSASPSLLRVPVEAIRQEGMDWVVYVVEEGRARRRVIEAGEIRDGMREVRAGLEAGQRVVVEGRERVTDGTLVKETAR